MHFSGRASWANLKDWLFRCWRGNAAGLHGSSQPMPPEVDQALEAFELVATLHEAKVPWKVVDKSLESFKRAIRVVGRTHWEDID